MFKKKTNLPFDVLNLILEYDGRIKYLHKQFIYVNKIHKNDYRYSIIETKINNQKNLINNFNIGNNGLKYYIDIYYKNDIIVKGLILTKKKL
jgi:dTDP-D-glucose 4,6-dehydratase